MMMIDYVKILASRSNTLGTRTGRRRRRQSRRRKAAPEGRLRHESPASPGAEAEKEGEADRKEVRAGPRGERGVEVVDG